MIQFKVVKKNDYLDTIYTVYDVQNYSLNDCNTLFLIYDKVIENTWCWVPAERFEPVEEDDNNGSA